MNQLEADKRTAHDIEVVLFRGKTFSFPQLAQVDFLVLIILSCSVSVAYLVRSSTY